MGSTHTGKELEGMGVFRCSYDLEAKTFRVNFGEVFELDTDAYDVFHTSKKRSYSKAEVSGKVKESFDAIIAAGGDEALSMYLSAHHRMLDDEDYDAKQLVLDCSDILIAADPIAEKYIEKVHHPEERPTRRRRSNEELQFTTEHDKLTLRVAFLMKFMVPLASEYLYLHKEQRPDTLLLDVYAECFEVACMGGDIVLTNKIYKLVESRIKTTRYSDRVIWGFLSIRSIDPITLADDFYRKMIVDIMVKLDNTKRVISYFHATLKNMLMYQFQCHFRDKWSSVDLHEVTDPQNERLTNFERLEFYMARVDESDAMVEEAKRLDIIVAAIKDPRYPVTADELDYYTDLVQLNPVQTLLMFLHNSRAIGKVQSLYGLKFGEYVVLLIHFRHWLNANGFTFLSRWVMATFPTGLEDSKKPVNTKDFVSGLTGSRSFKYLHDSKYEHVMPMLIKNSSIPQLISTIFTNEAMYTPSLEEFRSPSLLVDAKDINVDFSITHVADEVMRFLETV